MSTASLLVSRAIVADRGLLAVERVDRERRCGCSVSAACSRMRVEVALKSLGVRPFQRRGCVACLRGLRRGPRTSASFSSSGVRSAMRAQPGGCARGVVSVEPLFEAGDGVAGLVERLARLVADALRRLRLGDWASSAAFCACSSAAFAWLTASLAALDVLLGAGEDPLAHAQRGARLAQLRLERLALRLSAASRSAAACASASRALALGRLRRPRRPRSRPLSPRAVPPAPRRASRAPPLRRAAARPRRLPRRRFAPPSLSPRRFFAAAFFAARFFAGRSSRGAGSSANGHAPPACASSTRRPSARASRIASSPAAACRVVRRRSAIARESGLPAGLVAPSRRPSRRRPRGARRASRRAGRGPAAAGDRGLLRLAQRLARRRASPRSARAARGRPGWRSRRRGSAWGASRRPRRSRGRRPCGSPCAAASRAGVNSSSGSAVEVVDVSHRSPRRDDRAVPDPPAARHRGGRERRRDRPPAPTAISPAVPSVREPGERAVARLGQRQAGVAHQRVDLVGERDADDRLAVAGAGDRGGRVVGPRPGRDQRRVADAAGVLAARCRRSRSPPRRRRARRARPRRRSRRGCRRPPRTRAGGPRCETTPPARSRAPLARVRAGRVADEHHVPALVEHRARRAHRVADAGERGDGARGAVGAAHDRGVEADRALLVQRRAAAGVEDRVVLEHDHRRLHRGERVPAGRQHGVPGLDRPLRRPSRARPCASSGHFRPRRPPCTTIATSTAPTD